MKKLVLLSLFTLICMSSRVAFAPLGDEWEPEDTEQFIIQDELANFLNNDNPKMRGFSSLGEVEKYLAGKSLNNEDCKYYTVLGKYGKDRRYDVYDKPSVRYEQSNLGTKKMLTVSWSHRGYVLRDGKLQKYGSGSESHSHDLTPEEQNKLETENNALLWQIYSAKQGR